MIHTYTFKNQNCISKSHTIKYTFGMQSLENQNTIVIYMRIIDANISSSKEEQKHIDGDWHRVWRWLLSRISGVPEDSRILVTDMAHRMK